MQQEHTDDGASAAHRVPRRRVLVTAAALPAALLLASCDGGVRPPWDSRTASACLGPDEEISDEDRREYSPNIDVGPVVADPENRYSNREVAVSPDGSMIAVCETSDRRVLELDEFTGITLWDTASGEVVRRIEPPETGKLAWHPDGSRLAVGTGRIISLLDLEGNLEWSLLGHELPEGGVATMRALTFSPDGTQLASATSDESVRLWDLGDDSCGAGHILEPERLRNGSLSYSPDGATLAVGGASTSEEVDSSHAPSLWDPVTGDHRGATEDIPGIVHDLGYAADGSLLVIADDPPSLTVIAPDGSFSQGPAPASAWFADLAVGPGQRVAVRGADDELVLWDRATGETTRPEVPVDTDLPLWAPDESELYLVSRTYGPMAWDGENWRQFELP